MANASSADTAFPAATEWTVTMLANRSGDSTENTRMNIAHR